MPEPKNFRDRRLLQAVLVYPIFLAVLYLSSDYAIVHPWVIHPVAAATLFLSACRYYLIERYMGTSQTQKIHLCVLATASLFGLFLAATIALYGYESWPSLTLMVSLSASAAGSISTHAYDRRLSRWYLALLLSPSLGVHFYIGGPRGFSMIVLFALYLTFLLKQAATEFDDYRRGLDHAELLGARAVELESSRAAAEEANRAKSTFLANMSHELRTPLNIIIGYSEMLIEDMTALGQAGAVRDLERIRAAGRHQLILVNDILDLSKIEAGRLEVLVESFDVSALVADVMSIAQPLAQKNGNRLEYEADPNLGMVRSDVTKVRQILYNLLSNACKFTSNGVVTLTARRRENNGRAELELVVSDTGIGMTPAVVDKLFQPFVQADGSTTRLYGGSGLGLAITRSFCQLLGGTIQLDSTPGIGSTFSVTLPAAEPGDQLSRLAQSIAAKATEQVEKQPIVKA